MKIVTWNAQGLSRSEKKGVVRRLVADHKSEIVFLQESKLKTLDHRMNRKLGGRCLNKFVLANSISASSGLVCLWNENFCSLEVVKVGTRYVCLKGCIISKQFQCGFCNIYAPNDESERKQLWVTISR